MTIEFEFIKDAILIVSGIGTFISALIAAWTIIEVKKQRRSSYMPDLILDSYVAHCYWNRTFGEDIFFNFRRAKYNDWRKKTEKKEEEKLIYLLYKLQNIGLGVAKYVECSWEFDSKKAIKIVKQILPKNYEMELSKESFLLKRELDEYLSWSYFSDLDTDRTDYIHPETISSNLKDSTIPQVVLDLYLYYFIFKYNKLESKPDFDIEKYEDFPTLTMKVKYKDIRNRVYRKKFAFKIEFIEFDQKEERNDKDEFGMFYIYVKEK